MSVSFSLLIRHLSSQKRSSTSARFYQMAPAPSTTPARFSGPVCDLLDNNVIICTKTLRANAQKYREKGGHGQNLTNLCFEFKERY